MSEETAAIHLAWGADGAAIAVPSEATHWRVRLLPSKGGNPKVIRRAGIPLLLPISATLDLLREAVDGKPGLYRLDPCTEGCPIEDTDFAVIEVEGEEEEDASANDAPSGVVGELLKTNREMAQTLMHALATLSAQQQIAPILDASAALLHAADGAGLPERTPRRALVRAAQPQLAGAPAPADPSPLDKLLTMIVPFAPQLGAFLMAKLSGDPDIAAAARAQHGHAPRGEATAEEHDADAPEDEDDPADQDQEDRGAVRVEHAPPANPNGHHHPRNGTS